MIDQFEGEVMELEGIFGVIIPDDVIKVSGLKKGDKIKVYLKKVG